MGCLINYLITLSTVFKVPQTPGNPVCGSRRSSDWFYSRPSPLWFAAGSRRSFWLLWLQKTKQALLHLNFHRPRDDKRDNNDCRALNLVTEAFKSFRAPIKKKTKKKHRHHTRAPRLVNNADYLSFLSKVVMRSSPFCGSVAGAAEQGNKAQTPTFILHFSERVLVGCPCAA